MHVNLFLSCAFMLFITNYCTSCLMSANLYIMYKLGRDFGPIIFIYCSQYIYTQIIFITKEWYFNIAKFSIGFFKSLCACRLQLVVHLLLEIEYLPHWHSQVLISERDLTWTNPYLGSRCLCSPCKNMIFRRGIYPPKLHPGYATDLPWV